MKNWILGVISGLILAFLFVVLLGVLLLKLGSRPASVGDGTTLVLDLEGQIVEHNPSDVFGRLLQRGPRPTVREILESLDKAAADSHVIGMVVRERDTDFGWAKAQEIRGALQRFRKSGKKLYCHLVSGNLREYYVATACEKIFLQPVGMLDVKGVRAEAEFFRGTLDKLGVRAELIHTGPYKTFANAFTERQFTPEHKEMTTWLMDSLYQNALEGISEARGKSVDEVRALVEAGPYQAPEAKSAGLIDDTLYEDQVFDLIKNQDAKKRMNRVSFSRYVDVPLEDAGIRPRQRVAIVYAVGDIMQGDDGLDPLGGSQSVGSESLGRVLRQVADDTTIKAVVLRVDSPGGDALASETIWREVGRLQSRKPLVVSMSDVAASGGYYISAVGAPILADPSTITASIGVVYGKVNIHDLYNKLGITKDMIYRGPNATLDSDYTSYTPQQMEFAQTQLNGIYQAFLKRVADARKMKVEDVNAIGQGRVFTGTQAKERNLVDQLGGLQQAVEVAKQKAGISASERVRWVPYPTPRSLFEILMEKAPLARLFAPQVPVLPAPVRDLRMLRLLDGRPLALMPWRFELK